MADLVSLKAQFWRWALVQFASTFCLVHAVMLLLCGITRHAFGASTAPYVPHMLLLAVLFYGLHWRIQDEAYAMDPLRSDRIVSAMKMRPSRLDPDW